MPPREDHLKYQLPLKSIPSRYARAITAYDRAISNSAHLLLERVDGLRLGDSLPIVASFSTSEKATCAASSMRLKVGTPKRSKLVCVASCSPWFPISVRSVRSA